MEEDRRIYKSKKILIYPPLYIYMFLLVSMIFSSFSMWPMSIREASAMLGLAFLCFMMYFHYHQRNIIADSKGIEIIRYLDTLQIGFHPWSRVTVVSKALWQDVEKLEIIPQSVSFLDFSIYVLTLKEGDFFIFRSICVVKKKELIEYIEERTGKKFQVNRNFTFEIK